jgi:hypothetical protein
MRQFVITFPFQLRARLGYDGKLVAAVTRISVDSVLGFYRRRMRDEAAQVHGSDLESVLPTLVPVQSTRRLSGTPSAVIPFRILQPILASTRCPCSVRLRIVGPMMVL